MILDAILEFFFYPLMALFDLIPDFSINFNDFTYSNLAGWAQCLGYICPVAYVAWLTFMKINFRIAKVALGIIVRAKSFVPFWGA